MDRLRAVIYCRCSTDEECQIDALQKQVIEARACVEEHAWRLVDQYVESRSGTTSKERAEYLRLVDDMTGPKFDIIVIKSQDRLMRNTKDWYLFLDQMLANGKRLYLYLERKFYTTEDALVTGIKAILAEEYSRELSKKIVNAHRHRQQKGGRVMLTDQVLGFKKLPDGNVRIIEAEAELIRRIFQYCAAGYGSRTIANILQKEGVKSKRGNDMTPATIRKIIRNPLFKGVFVMNRQHFDFETKRTVKNPEEQWIYQEGIVPAIVDEGLWERANQAMSSRAEQNQRQGGKSIGSNKGTYLLSGKLVCGHCGRPYYRTCRHGYSDSGRTIIEWKCSGYITGGRRCKNHGEQLYKEEPLQHTEGCDSVHIDEEVLLKSLEQTISRYYQLGREQKEKIIQKAMCLLEQSLDGSTSQKTLERLQREEEELIRKQQILLDKLLDGIVSDTEYDIKHQVLETHIRGLEAKKRDLQSKPDEQAGIRKRLEEIKNKLEHGGLERAAVGAMLKQVEHMVVHEWQIEIQFISTQQKPPVFFDYPFAPSTEKGRILDKIRILHLLEKTPGLTAGKIAGQLGRTKSVVNNRIRELRKDGYLIFCGAGGHGQWEVLQKGKMFLSECANTSSNWIWS